jgi:hypothetical protein
MQGKHRIKWAIKKVLGVQTWRLVIIWVAIFPVMLIALRVDNLRMERLRNEVFAADETGDEAKISEALNNLRDFTAHHMNANTGTFYLQHSYQRAVSAAAASVDETNIYKETSAYCERLFNNKWSFAFVQCMVDGLAAYPAATVANFPDPALFRYDFISPAFSFSVAGVVCAIWFLMSFFIAVRLLYYMVLRISLLILRKKA